MQNHSKSISDYINMLWAAIPYRRVTDTQDRQTHTQTHNDG